MIHEKIELVPQNVQAEDQVLGILMRSNTALAKVPWLEPEDFFDPTARRIFESIVAMVEKGLTANALTLKDLFEPGVEVDGLPPLAYLARLETGIANTDPIGFARALRYSRSRRVLVEIGEDLANAARKAPPEVLPSEIQGEADDRLAEVRLLQPRQDSRTAIGSYADTFVASLSADRNTAKGVSLVFPELEQIIQEPLEGGNLYGLLSSSGEGKTSLVLQMAEYAARKGSPVLLMSFDQNGEQVIRQVISQSVGTEVSRIRRRDVSEKEVERMLAEVQRIKSLPFEIIRCKREKIGRITSYARAFVKRWQMMPRPGGAWGTPLIILDHSRKVAPDRPNDHEGRIAGAINGECKATAEETGAAWMNINQRNSGGMTRPNPRPIARDLFGGEQAKEDFDACFYLYRAEKWRDEQLKVARDVKEKEQIMQRFGDCEGKAEIGAIKVRYGSDRETRNLNWEGRYTRYSSPSAVYGEELF